MRRLPDPTRQPATVQQHAEILRLLAGPYYNANHREYYCGQVLPGLDWAGAARLIHQLARRYSVRPTLLDYASQGLCPQGPQGRREYAAVVQLTRTAPGDSGGRFCRAQPGQLIYLKYYTN